MYVYLLLLSMPVLGLDASKHGQNDLLQAGRCFLDVQAVPKVKGSRELYRTVFSTFIFAAALNLAVCF